MGEGVDKRDSPPVLLGMEISTRYYGEQKVHSFTSWATRGAKAHQSTPGRISGQHHRLRAPTHPITTVSSQDWGTTKISRDGWGDKDYLVCVYNRMWSFHIKEWNQDISGNMDGPRHNHTNWSSTYAERHVSHDTHKRRHFQLDRIEFIYKTERDLTDLENKLRIPRWKE